ncbi:hypothetical protein LCGC14_0984450 [marine sediment metagenome]|uniref:Uncharacterized protein n=1 Tax=marine sediment metagenome TaxID=412755 RepID=A0A0F9N7M3_9ZZZZ
MTTPQPSKGPDRVPTPANYQEFADAVIDADGEWIEMEIGHIRASHGTSIERQIGHLVAEVSVRNGTAYGRMRRSNTEE